MRKQLPNLVKKALFALLLCSSQVAIAQYAPEFEGHHGYSGYEGNTSYDGNTFYEGSGSFNPCCPKQHCRFLVNAELLYFKPTIEQASYVIDSFDNDVGDEFFPNGPRNINSAPYKPGFRVGGMIDNCCGDKAFAFRFTYLDAGYRDSTTGIFLFDTIGYPGEGAQAPEDTFYTGTASVHDSFRYYAFDLTLNRFSFNNCSENLFFLVGLHYANIRYNRTANSVGFSVDGTTTVPVDNSFYSHSNFWGIGPEVGVDYCYHLNFLNSCWGNFALNASGRGALLASSTTARLNYTSNRTDPSGGIALSSSEVWRVSPTFDATLGGSYKFRLFCMDICVEAGYEWMWYSDSVDNIVGYDVAFPGDSIDLYSNLSLQGPYLRLNLDF